MALDSIQTQLSLICSRILEKVTDEQWGSVVCSCYVFDLLLSLSIAKVSFWTFNKYLMYVTKNFGMNKLVIPRQCPMRETPRVS